MENPNEGNNYMPKSDWQNADNDSRNEDTSMMPGTAGNISSPTDQYSGEFQASDRQDDPGNAKENDAEEENDDETEEEADDDAPHMNDWGDVDPQHGGGGSNAPSFPGSAI